MIFLQNIGYGSNVFAHSCRRWSSASLLITNRLSPFWKCIVPTKHCCTMHSRLTINFLNHFKCFYSSKTGFSAKTNCCVLFNCFFHYDLWHGQNRQITSRRKYVPFWERFKLKLGMHREKGLSMNFPMFHGDRATSTMFSQRCRETYWTDLVFISSVRWPLSYRSHSDPAAAS